MKGPTSRRVAVAAALGSTLLVLCGALAVDGYARRGLTVDWRTLRPDTERGGNAKQLVVVARTVEPRTRFPNRHRALARYAQNWNFDHWGVPTDLPPLDAYLRGTLTVPEGEKRLVRAKTPNGSDLRIDGHIPSKPLAAGEHDIEVWWHGHFTPGTSLRLEWSTANAFERIPDSAFTPEGSHVPPLRAALWWAAALLSLVFALLTYFALRLATETGRRRVIAALAAGVLLLFCVGYRAFDYDVMPELLENPDELFATWNGWQLLEDGTTRGWSLWPEYYGKRVKVEHLSYFRTRPIRIIRPYFEHPPLLHLFAGAAAKIGGAKNWAHARLKHTRIVPIAFSAMTLMLLLAIGRRLDRAGPSAFLGGLLYAVLPMIALQGRVIKEEALVAPLALACVLFFLRWRDDGERTRDLVLAAACAGLCTLAKIPGIVLVGALVLLVAERRRYGAALIAAGVGALAASLLLVYAAAIDWDVFWFTTAKQATGRPSHWNLFPRFFDDPLVNHNMIGRGWLLFLWIAWALSLAKFARKNAAVLSVPPVVYLLGIGISSGNWTFGWYLMPIYPFLCLGAGRFIVDLWNRPGLVYGFFFVTLCLMYGMNFTLEVDYAKVSEHWSEIRRVVTLFTLAFIAPYALVQALRSKATVWIARATTVVGICLLVALSARVVVKYEEFYETYRNFDRMEYFDR